MTGLIHSVLLLMNTILLAAIIGELLKIRKMMESATSGTGKPPQS